MIRVSPSTVIKLRVALDNHIFVNKDGFKQGQSWYSN